MEHESRCNKLRMVASASASPPVSKPSVPVIAIFFKISCSFAPCFAIRIISFLKPEIISVLVICVGHKVLFERIFHNKVAMGRSGCPQQQYSQKITKNHKKSQKVDVILFDYL